ncbi:hypothetical protein O6H91_Y208300 [Diphasiastrum complanatum]|nr:hypothetical protein O6H91_Y208300 [Diphasiastrum complanatum]
MNLNRYYRYYHKMLCDFTGNTFAMLLVTVLEKEEEKRRFRAKSLQHISPDVSSPQSMEMLFQQIGNINPQAGDQSPLLNDAAASQKTDSSKDAEPSSRTSEPVGHGDTFIPGTWRPS